MEVLPTFCVGHMDDSAMQPTEQVHALLAIRYSRVLGGEDRSVEHRSYKKRCRQPSGSDAPGAVDSDSGRALECHRLVVQTVDASLPVSPES